MSQEEVWTSIGLSTQDLPLFLLSSTCLQGRSYIQTYLHGQDGLSSKLAPQPPLWEFGIGTERFPSVWLLLEMGETPTGELLKVAIAHRVDRDAEKPLYRVSSREGMKVLYTAVVFAAISFRKLSFLPHLGSEGHL